MTREEAIEIYLKICCETTAWANCTLENICAASAAAIDAYVALGMLKLDEPKSADEKATSKAVDALGEAGWSLNVLNVLDRAGLKIVNK